MPAPSSTHTSGTAAGLLHGLIGIHWPAPFAVHRTSESPCAMWLCFGPYQTRVNFWDCGQYAAPSTRKKDRKTDFVYFFTLFHSVGGCVRPSFGGQPVSFK
jgi:hypothetical protein